MCSTKSQNELELTKIDFFTKKYENLQERKILATKIVIIIVMYDFEDYN